MAVPGHNACTVALISAVERDADSAGISTLALRGIFT